MSKITAKSAPHIRVRRPVVILAACVVLVFAMSVTAFAANAFGIRDLAGNFFGWSVNDSAGVLELDTEGRTTVGTWTEEGKYVMNLKSMTLSPTELTFSYTFQSDSGKTPLPGTLGIKMTDGTTTDAVITDTALDGDLLKGTASFSSPVNLDEAVAVLFGGPADAKVNVVLIIPVNADAPWPSDPPPVQTPTAEDRVQIMTSSQD